MDIAIDANILISDPWFSSPRMRALFDFVTKTGSYVVLHEVVEREVKAHFRRKYATAVQKVQRPLKEAERLGVVGIPEFDRERVLADTYAKWERHFQEAFDSDITFRIPTGDHHYEEALRRAIERVPPCSSKGEGMRDAIIWLDLLEASRFSGPVGPITFVSDNTGDFAGPDKESLRGELVEDLTRHEATITYYPSLERFLRDHAEPVAHITEEWIREQIRSYDLEGELRAHLAFGSYERAFKPTGASFYADSYEPIGRPDIMSVQTDLRLFHVWRFDDEHTEIVLGFNAYIEADIECERVDAPPTSSYGDEHYREVREYRGRTLPCRAEMEFEMVADLQGDGISIRGIESIFAF